MKTNLKLNLILIKLKNSLNIESECEVAEGGIN